MLPLGAALFFGWHVGTPLPGKGTAQLATLSTMVWATIVITQMANALECRSTSASLWSIGPLSNRLLIAALGMAALVVLALIYVPALSDIVGQQPLSLSQWVVMLVAPWILLAAEEMRKFVVRHRSRATEIAAVREVSSVR
jgi:Ca2+-transporting ATPase